MAVQPVEGVTKEKAGDVFDISELRNTINANRDAEFMRVSSEKAERRKAQAEMEKLEAEVSMAVAGGTGYGFTIG